MSGTDALKVGAGDGSMQGGGAGVGEVVGDDRDEGNGLEARIGAEDFERPAAAASNVDYPDRGRHGLQKPQMHADARRSAEDIRVSRASTAGWI